MTRSLAESPKPEKQTRARSPMRARALMAGWLAGAVLGGCALPGPPSSLPVVQLPVLQGWFDGETVFYLTTDVSDAVVAKEKRANHVPRLADALPASPRQPGQRSSVDKVYAITNFKQGSVFASAPSPLGAGSLDTAYTPLWQMVKVTWVAGRTPQTLTSQEQVLRASDQGLVTLSETSVVLNCPIIQRGARDALPGASISPINQIR